MKTKMHENSLITYETILNSSNVIKKKIVEYLIKNNQSTRQQLSQDLHLPINTICGRVNELLKTNIVKENGVEYFEKRPRSIIQIC